MVCCVRLTDSMMCSIQAFELAMASTASTFDIEDGPIPMKDLYIEIQQNQRTTLVLTILFLIARRPQLKGFQYMSGIGIYIGTKCPGYKLDHWINVSQ